LLLRRQEKSLTADGQIAAGAVQSGGKVLAGKMYVAGKNTQAGSIAAQRIQNSSQDRRSQFGCMQIYDEPQDAWTINDK
jgi:hypothetical protein